MDKIRGTVQPSTSGCVFIVVSERQHTEVDRGDIQRVLKEVG